MKLSPLPQNKAKMGVPALEFPGSQFNFKPVAKAPTVPGVLCQKRPHRRPGKANGDKGDMCTTMCKTLNNKRKI